MVRYMAATSTSSKAFKSLIAAILSRPERKPPASAKALLARALAPDARTFLEAWASHMPPHISIGELWFDDRDPGGDVPQEDDYDMTEPMREDVLMFAHSPGGDLFALKPDGKGKLGAVVRIKHDDGWQEWEEAESLAAFVEKCFRAAKEKGEQTSLDAPAKVTGAAKKKRR